MVRPDLKNLPSLDLPDGLSARQATEEDAQFLASTLTAAFGETWSHDRVLTGLLHAPDVDSTWVLELDNHVVATCSCQNRNRPGTLGTLHWVGANPAVMGKKLGYWVCLVAIHEFAQTGYHQCDLTTDDARLAAIKTYLNLGFEPCSTADDHPQRWSEVLTQLNPG